MKSNANQARELRSSLAPCSLRNPKKIEEIQCKSSQGAQIQPCSLLLARIQESNILSCRGTTPGPQPATGPQPRTLEIYEIS